MTNLQAKRPGFAASPAAVLLVSVGVIAAASVHVFRGAAADMAAQPVRYDMQFNFGLKEYAPGRVASAGVFAEFPETARALMVGEFTAVEFAGEQAIFTRIRFPVDDTTSYQLKARARVVRDDPRLAGSVLYVGLVMYDEDGQELAAPGGGFRYPAAQRARLSADQDWVVFEGRISGTGDQPTTFLPGTAFVRPVVLVNRGAPGAVTQLDYLLFRPAPR